MNQDFENLLDLEHWDKVFDFLTADTNLVSEIDAEYLAMKNFQYALVENGKEQHIFPYTNPVELKKTISFCRQNGLLADNIPTASSFQDISRIEYLIANGHQIDEHSFGERTGLIVAAALNDIDLVDFFLSKGAFVSFTDFENYEAIDYTTNSDIFELLKSNGGKTKDQRKQDYDEYCDAREKLNILREINYSFIKAAKSDDLEKMKELLKQSSMDFWTLNCDYAENKKSALHLAVENDNINMIKFLLDNGINKYSKTTDGLTALDFARKLNRTEAIKLFDSND